MNEISDEDYLVSLGPDAILNCFWTNNYSSLYELCSSGKSGSLFYYTEDQKYMLKTISKDEFKKFKSILKEYYTHLESNPESLITRFYGLHKMIYKRKKSMKMEKKYLVIMNNVFGSIKIGNRFDLKGSTVGRLSLRSINDYTDPDRDVNKILKDLDFDKNVGQIKVKAGEGEGKKTIEEILELDSLLFS
mmetsp:Transcript_22526/g.21674  ORF Transcript_22526/g.21674 Transcript_22526/m.21674 type:complete len:190 (+) Transcript_22526:2018-2587(+)